MEPDEESYYTPEEKVGYLKIREYVKGKCGLEMGQNYYKSKKEKSVARHCLQESVECIKDALGYYGLN